MTRTTTDRKPAADVLAFTHDDVKPTGGRAALEPRVFEGPPTSTARFLGRRVINLASNDYLGLSGDSRLKAAVVECVHRYGVGSGGSKAGAGTTRLHQELERRLACFKQTEAALVFPAGSLANTGTIPTLVAMGDVIVSDELNHPSVTDGARLSGATLRIYTHGDVGHAEQLLSESQGARRRLLVTSGVFAMDGDLAPLTELAAVGNRYGAILMVDDAHGSGVVGRGGRGTADHFGVREQVSIQVGTLSKAFGAQGGFLAGAVRLINWVTTRARPIYSSTSLAPPAVAAGIAALDVLEREPERVERLRSRGEFFRGALRARGLDIGASVTPLVPVLVGDAAIAVEMSHRLWAGGVFLPALIPPAVTGERARLRAIVTSEHSEAELAVAARVCGEVAHALGLLEGPRADLTDDDQVDESP
jgi:glycine C-acetyltransferase